MKILKCPICGKVREAPRRHQVCSHECAAVLHKQRYGADYHQRTGRKAGVISGKGSMARADVMWRERWPDVPAEMARAIYTRGYNSGFALGKRRGYRKGFAEAIGEPAERKWTRRAA